MTFDVFKLYATDPVAEQKGRGFTKEFGGGATFYIARSNNRSYQDQLQAEYKSHEFTFQRGQAKDASEDEKKEAEDLSFALIGRVMARTILLGWDLVSTVNGETKVAKNQVGYKGELLAYSADNAEKLLSHREFRDKVATISGNYEKYLFEMEEADAKNSVDTSPGTSSGGAASDTSSS